MQKYLSNLALVLLNQYMTENGIPFPPEGSHIHKYPRKQVYTLVNSGTYEKLVSVEFFRNGVPRYTIHKTK